MYPHGIPALVSDAQTGDLLAKDEITARVEGKLDLLVTVRKLFGLLGDVTFQNKFRGVAPTQDLTDSSKHGM